MSPISLPVRHPIVVIEFDSRSLHEQELSLVERIKSSCIHIPVYATNDYASLSKLFADLEGVRADAVVLVGHGGRSGLRLGEDASGLTPWGLLAARLRALRPRKLFVVAGPASRNSDLAALFRELPALQEVLGCALYVDDHRLTAILKVLPELLTFPEHSPSIRAWALARGVVHRVTRTEYEEGGEGAVVAMRLVGT